MGRIQGPDNDAISRLTTYAVQCQDCANVLHNLEIDTQFPDSKNVQCNFKIAQIPKLRGTHKPSELIFIDHENLNYLQDSVH